jgi:hypothetical protein
MKTIRGTTVSHAVVTVVLTLAAAAGQARAGEPLDAYKAYLAAASKATAPDALFPFVSSEYKSMLQQAPKEEVAKMLKMSIAKQGLSDLKVTSQKVEGNKAILELTGKLADGRSSSGKATMVKEGGDWKLDEDAWATPTK